MFADWSIDALEATKLETFGLALFLLSSLVTLQLIVYGWHRTVGQKD